MRMTLLMLSLSASTLLAAPEAPDRFSAQKPQAAGDLSAWWKSFRDPQLDRLIDEALAGNHDLQSAAARVREARAKRLATLSDFWPQLKGDGSITRDKPSTGGRFGQFSGFGQVATVYSTSLDASWELDIFGRTRQAVRAASAAAAAAEEGRRQLLVSLLAEVAGNYVELRGLQVRLGVVRQNVESQSQTVKLTRSRQEAGLSPELVVAQAEAQLATTKAAIPDLESGIQQAIHRLALLCGKAPGSMATELSGGGAIPSGPGSLPAGFPSDLLLRRPDVRQAEQQFAAAAARLGQARAERMPRFSIRATAGFEGHDSSTLFERSSQTWQIGPQLSIPLFTGGKLKAAQQAAKAAAEQADRAWQQSLLSAVTDVEDALVALRQSQAKLAALREAEAASQKTEKLASDLYKNGLGDFLNVLEAQRTALAAQEQVVIAQREVSVSLVRLYKALGGGWEGK